MNIRSFLLSSLVAVLSVATSTSCTPAPDLIWKEGKVDPQTNLVVNELLICNAPEGLDWDLWGYFYQAPSLPCKAVEGSMAQMHMFSGSFWRVEPTHAADTVVLKYVDKRKKHSYAPHGFNIKFRKSGKTISLPIQHQFQPCEKAAHPSFPLVKTGVTDIVPAVKSIVQGKGSSAIENIEDRLIDGLRPEGYRLVVADGKAIVEASDCQGLRYGRITLEKFMENAGSGVLPDMVVEDWPDFPYRAQMIDVSRLYFSLDELKSLVNVLERCKVNTLALHLNDDESWRLEIEGLPELTSYGAFHALPDYQEDGTYVCHDGIHPINGSALGKVWGGTSGYYSRKDFIEFIQYAHDHGVKVVPELDIPGHCYSAVEAMKYRERITGDTSFRLIDPSDTSSYCSLQGYYGNVIDIALPSVFNFLGKVFDSIVSMYAEAGVPLDEIAVGGDEVAEGAWEGSPACRALMTEKGYASVDQVRGDFFRKVNVMLRERGVRISGYHEIVQGVSDEIFAEIAENCGHIIVWLPLKYTDHTHLAYTLANKGMNVVMSMGCHLYFDNTRSMNWDERGLTWAGTLDERKVFTFLPFNLAASNRFDNYNNPCDLSVLQPYIPELKRPENISGMQPMVWCSNIWKTEDAFEMVLPKAYGAWERSWNACPTWEQSTKAEDPAFEEDFLRFYTIVRQRELPYLEKMGLNYWRSL